MEGGGEVWQGPQHHGKHLQAEECSPQKKMRLKTMKKEELQEGEINVSIERIGTP